MTIFVIKLLVCNPEVAGSIPVVSAEHLPEIPTKLASLCGKFPRGVERSAP